MFLVVLLLGLLNFFWGERVPAGGGLGWDGVLYADMVRNLGSMISGGQLNSYYAQRFLPSAIVRGMLLFSGVPMSSTNIIRGFEVYNLILLLGACWVWKRVADFFHLSLAGRWIGFSGIFVNYECSKQAFYYPVLTDVTALFIAMLLLLFYAERKPFALFITTVIGAFSWPVVSVFGALLLLFLRAKLPKDVVAPPSPIFTASIFSLLKRVGIALIALSIIGYIIMTQIGPTLDLQCKVHAIFAHALSLFVSSCAPRREHLGYERLLTALPSLFGMLIALVLLAGSRRFFYSVFVSIRRAQITLVALSIAAVLVPFCLVKAISNPGITNANSLRGLILGMILSEPGKFLLSFVTLAVFWGPVLLLVMLYWKAFCVEARRLGPGVVAILGMSMLLGLNSEPRFLTVAWPFFVLCLVLTFETAHTKASFKYVLLALTVVYAQFWMKINLAPWSQSDFEGLQNYPKQIYFMHYGLWMNWWSYSIQLIALILSAIWLHKTIRTVGQLDASTTAYQQ
jgi:hypothetical protein